MGGTLRVNPDLLRNAARAQADVGESVSGLAAGQSLHSAGLGVSGLLSEGACQFASSVVNAALNTVREDLTKHSNNLSTAADRYHRTDEEFGRRLRRFTQ